MDLTVQSGDIHVATKHWKNVTSIIQLVATDTEETLKRQESLTIVKRNIQ
jgi:hypothetical protein